MIMIMIMILTTASIIIIIIMIISIIIILITILIINSILLVIKITINNHNYNYNCNPSPVQPHPIPSHPTPSLLYTNLINCTSHSMFFLAKLPCFVALLCAPPQRDLVSHLCNAALECRRPRSLVPLCLLPQRVEEEESLGRSNAG